VPALAGFVVGAGGAGGLGGGAKSFARVSCLCLGSRGMTSLTSSGCFSATTVRNSACSSLRTASFSMSAFCFSLSRARIVAMSSAPGLGGGSVATETATSPPPGREEDSPPGARRGARGAEAHRTAGRGARELARGPAPSPATATGRLAPASIRRTDFPKRRPRVARRASAPTTADARGHTAPTDGDDMARACVRCTLTRVLGGAGTRPRVSSSGGASLPKPSVLKRTD
jgi:hypothetical protein